MESIKKPYALRLGFIEVPDGFEPPIRELQSHALPLGYGTIFIYLFNKTLIIAVQILTNNMIINKVENFNYNLL